MHDADANRPIVAIRGELVSRYRDLRGWTQGELAYHAGVDQSQISKIEAGRHADVRLSTARRLALALGVSLDDLAGLPRMTGEPSNQKLSLLQQIDRDPRISPAAREVIKRLVAEDYDRWEQEQKAKRSL